MLLSNTQSKAQYPYKDAVGELSAAKGLEIRKQMNFKEPWQTYQRQESEHFHCKPTERKTNKLNILIYLGPMLMVSKKFILKLFIHIFNIIFIPIVVGCENNLKEYMVYKKNVLKVV